jgi:transposase InsO family protein
MVRSPSVSRVDRHLDVFISISLALRSLDAFRGIASTGSGETNASSRMTIRPANTEWLMKRFFRAFRFQRIRANAAATKKSPARRQSRTGTNYHRYIDWHGVCTENLIRIDWSKESPNVSTMIALLCFVLAVLAAPFKSKSRLEAENAALRHQLIVLRRKVRGRARLTNNDRWFLIQLYRWFPSILQVVAIVQPQTLVRWHRAGFRRYWRWKSRSLGGRPQIETDLRALIRRMSIENPLWGAPRIHGELLKLGFDVAQSSVARYMVKRRGPPSQGWPSFLRNHAPDIAAMDLFIVPTVGFDLLYAFVIVGLSRRNLVWINVTTNPTAEWIARQITEAFPWNEGPRYLVRDRDQIFGAVVMRRIRAMGIRDKPIAPVSPWQNGFAERLIGSIRRECVDHFVVLGEAHLRRILQTYARYYNNIGTHRSFDKDAPVSRPIQLTGIISSHPILGGLHHHYVRV